MIRPRGRAPVQVPQYEPVPIIDVAAYTPPAWTEQAACLGHDPGLWFPETGQTSLTRAAKRICSGCPVTGECRAAGRLEPHGVWGGQSISDRSRGRNRDQTRIQRARLTEEAA